VKGFCLLRCTGGMTFRVRGLLCRGQDLLVQRRCLIPDRPEGFELGLVIGKVGLGLIGLLFRGDGLARCFGRQHLAARKGHVRSIKPGFGCLKGLPRRP
jgi:hypothetical protein